MRIDAHKPVSPCLFVKGVFSTFALEWAEMRQVRLMNALVRTF